MINFTKPSAPVFWFSRHDPTPEQLDGLRRYVREHVRPVADDVVIHKVDVTAADGKAAAALWRGEPVIVAVMPPAMLSEFINALLHDPHAGPLAIAHVLLPRSKRERTPDGDVAFVYDGFDRVLECRFRVEHVE